MLRRLSQKRSSFSQPRTQTKNTQNHKRNMIARKEFDPLDPNGEDSFDFDPLTTSTLDCDNPSEYHDIIPDCGYTQDGDTLVDLDDYGRHSDNEKIRLCPSSRYRRVALSLSALAAFASILFISRRSERERSLKVDIPSTNGSIPLYDEMEEALDPCSVDHWKFKLAEADAPLKELRAKDMGFIYTTFSLNGDGNAKPRDRSSKDQRRKLGKHEDRTGHHVDRMSELNYSVSCLEKSIPNVAYEHAAFGDFPTYESALTEIHTWAARESPFKGNFFIDTDVFANPLSKVGPEALAWALHNVDFALAYNAKRDISSPKLQSGGLQGSLIGYRKNARSELFHTCVAHVLQATPGLRQQHAINQVLESPVGQYIRVRWLPPEFLCWAPFIKSLAEFFIPQGPVLMEDTNCFFIHSHPLAQRPDELQGCL